MSIALCAPSFLLMYDAIDLAAPLYPIIVPNIAPERRRKKFVDTNPKRPLGAP